MRVRKALPEDAEVITNINVETWKAAYKGLMDDDILDNRKADDKRIAHWKEVIENPSLLVLVCEDKEILGYLCAGKARDDYGIKNEDRFYPVGGYNGCGNIRSVIACLTDDCAQYQDKGVRIGE